MTSTTGSISGASERTRVIVGTHLFEGGHLVSRKYLVAAGVVGVLGSGHSDCSFQKTAPAGRCAPSPTIILARRSVGHSIESDLGNRAGRWRASWP